MNCLAMLAHCHRTGTRVRVVHHRTNVSNANANANAANVMEASLYDRSPVRCVITPEAMQDLLSLSLSGLSGVNKCCPITQVDLAEGDAVLVLPCGHAFLKDAIQTWLETESATCPVCRHALPSREMRPHVKSDSTDSEDAAQ
jgi:hypothetical protein